MVEGYAHFTNAGFYMVVLAETEILLVIGIIILLLTSLTGMIAIMSILRHHRHLQQDRALAALPGYSNGNHRPAEATLEKLRQEKIATHPAHIPIPDHLRLPVQPGAADMEVIKIEPKPGKTKEQRNVERIIDYFKRDAAASNAAAN